MIVCPWKDIKKYASLLPGIDEAFDAVNALTEYENKKAYPLSNDNRFFVAAQSTIAPAIPTLNQGVLLAALLMTCAKKRGIRTSPMTSTIIHSGPSTKYGQ